MPRGPRLDAPGSLHHVMGRGIERREIFLDDHDRFDFLERLERLTAAGALSLYAWALMPNHFHLLCRTGNEPLSRSMSSLLTGYATRFNRRHDRVGHLFQNRFKSILCEEEGYFRDLVRYIHLNPIRAGMIQGIDELDVYRWTGHGALMGNRPAGPLDVEHVLSSFDPTVQTARATYRHFVAEKLEEMASESGEASTPVGFRAHPTPRAERDSRVLGSAELGGQMRSEGVRPRRARLGLASERKLRDLLSLVSAECATSAAALASGSKVPACARAREGIAHLWLDVIGGSCRELVTALGVAEPSIYRAAKRGRCDRERWSDLLHVSSKMGRPVISSQ